MSHFSLLVIVASNVQSGNLKAELQRQLLPYKEVGCGDEDPPELRQYCEFEPSSEVDDYATDTVRVFINPEGKVFHHGEDQFEPDDGGSQGACPEGWTEDPEYPVNKLYPTVDEYMTEYAGYSPSSKNPETGQWGRWRNPNQRWDWWVVGGRYADRLVTKQGKVGDAFRRFDIDFEKREEVRDARFEAFVRDFTAWCDGTYVATSPFDMFEGPRSQGLDVGLVRVRSQEERDQVVLTEGQHIRVLESRPGHLPRYDLVTLPSPEELEHYRPCFLPCYAVLDADGWHENGEMGWFGMVHGADTAKYGGAALKQAMWDRVKTGDGDPLAWVVQVDCHT